MIKVFEMFAGYGGASFALKRIGIDFEVVGYSEINKLPIKIFELNHPGIMNYGDCTKIEPEKLPDFDLLTGGFPCQSFSVAGKRKGFDDTRGTLFFDIIRIINVKKPKYLVLENVKGLTTHDEGNTLKVILNELRKSGYSVLYKVMNSKDYGIPQNRERIWFVCKKGSWDFMEFQFPEKKELKITVRDLLIDDSNRKKVRNKRIEKILKYYTGRENLLFELVDDTPSGLSRQCDRIYSLKYSPCLNCTQTEYLFFDDGEIITLTGDEAFRLMGFNKDEINLDKLNNEQKLKLAGNGWDINVASKIFKNLFKNEVRNNVIPKIM